MSAAAAPGGTARAVTPHCWLPSYVCYTFTLGVEAVTSGSPGPVYIENSTIFSDATIRFD